LPFRYRGSRRESAVAQLSTLGGKRAFMPSYIIPTLVLEAVACLIISASTSSALVRLLAWLLVPLVGGILSVGGHGGDIYGMLGLFIYGFVPCSIATLIGYITHRIRTHKS
jgi:hypothetical protein